MGLEDAGGEPSVNMMAVSIPTPLEISTWIGDSGATEHATNSTSHFISYTQLNPPAQVKVANNSYMSAVGKGTVALEVQSVEGKWVPLILEGVLHIPQLSGSFISLTTLDKQGASIHMTGGQLRISKGGSNTLVMKLQGKLYCMTARELHKDGPVADGLRKRGYMVGSDVSITPQVFGAVTQRIMGSSESVAPASSLSKAPAIRSMEGGRSVGASPISKAPAIRSMEGGIAVGASPTSDIGNDRAGAKVKAKTGVTAKKAQRMKLPVS